MTDERGVKTGVIDTVIDGVSVYFDGMGVQIDDIPSDGQEQAVLSMASHGNSDLFMQLLDLTGQSYIPNMRFNAGHGGSNIDLIFLELVSIRDSFRWRRGQLMNVPPLQVGVDVLARHIPLRVQEGRSKDGYLYRVTGITDDKDPGELGSGTQMDLELARSGDVTVSMRGSDEQLPLSIVFKTGENGGKFPVMAQTFGRITQRLARAH